MGFVSARAEDLRIIRRADQSRANNGDVLMKGMEMMLCRVCMEALRSDGRTAQTSLFVGGNTDAD